MDSKTTHTFKVEFDVVASTEEKANKSLHDFLSMSAKEFAIENRIIAWEITKESNCSGCGNHNIKQR